MDEVDEYAPPKRLLSMRHLVYGEAGVGKTTYAMQSSKRPIVFSFDDGLSQFDPEDYYMVPVAKIATWPGLLGEIRRLAARAALPEGCRSVVFDQLGDVQKRIVDFCCKRDHGTQDGKRRTWVDGKADITGYGFGGNDLWTTALTEWDEFKSALESLQRRHDCDIVLLGHAENHKIKRAGGNDYSIIEPSINTSAASKMIAWADICLYVAYDQVSVVVDDKAKRDKRVTTGDRTAYTAPSGGAHSAKNRRSLPAEIKPFSWHEVAALIAANSPEATRELRANVRALANRRRDPEVLGKMTRAGTSVPELTALLRELQEYVETKSKPVRAEIEATLEGEEPERARTVREYIKSIDEVSYLQKALKRRQEQTAAT